MHSATTGVSIGSMALDVELSCRTAYGCPVSARDVAADDGAHVRENSLNCLARCWNRKKLTGYFHLIVLLPPSFGKSNYLSNLMPKGESDISSYLLCYA